MINFRKSKFYKKLIGIICIISIFTFNYNTALAKSSKDKNYGSRWAETTVNDFVKSGYIGSEDSIELGKNITFVEANNFTNRYISRQLNLDNELNILKLDTSLYSEAMLYDYTTNDYYLTREEFAYMYCKTLNIEPLNCPKDYFSDDELISDYAKGYIYALEQRGIIKGYPDKKYNPKKNVTIAEFATILNRSKSLIKNAYRIETQKLAEEAKKSAVSGNTVSSNDLFNIGDKIQLNNGISSEDLYATGDKLVLSYSSGYTTDTTSKNLLDSGEYISLEDENIITSEELDELGESIKLESNDDTFIDKGLYHVKIGKDFSASIAYYIDGKLCSLPIDEDISTIEGATMEVVFTLPKEYEDSKIKTTLSNTNVVEWNQNNHSLKTIGLGDVDVTFAIPHTTKKTSFKLSVVDGI